MKEKIFYAGIVPEKISKNLEEICKTISFNLSIRGFTLRTFGSRNFKNSFEIGCDIDQGEKEVFYPFFSDEIKQDRENHKIFFADELYEKNNNILYDMLKKTKGLDKSETLCLMSFLHCLFGKDFLNTKEMSKFFIFYYPQGEIKNFLIEMAKILNIFYIDLSEPKWNCDYNISKILKVTDNFKN
ncbi:MAG: hypothetical protein NZZ41_02175 [Candidatus Dojkabacteria bacterium]|nr:hypothetical protein [Candidatus Dojkabacteria bacterium]